MKIIFAIAVLLLSAAFTKAQTTGWVELQNAITTKKTVPQFDGVVDCKINDRLSFSAWFLLSEEYSEGYAGVSYTPKAWVSVSGQIGLETAENPLRVAGTIWLGKNRESLLIILEGGGSGRWHKVEYNHRLGAGFSAGYLDQAFKGRGPRGEFEKGKAKIWGAILWGKDGKNALVGVRFSF